jgi:hypothetical protein
LRMREERVLLVIGTAVLYYCGMMCAIVGQRREEEIVCQLQRNLRRRTGWSGFSGNDK